jgi:hypothetical protein
MLITPAASRRESDAFSLSKVAAIFHDRFTVEHRVANFYYYSRFP